MVKKNKILVACLALLLVLSVGYALFSETITINGTATAKGNFDIDITCQTGLADVDGLYDNAFNVLNGQETENGYSSDDCSVVDNTISFKTNLNAPGAMRYYTIKATNNGTIDAIAPIIITPVLDAQMGEEMYNIVRAANKGENFESSKNFLFSSDSITLTDVASTHWSFEEFSFAYIIETKEGDFLNFYEMSEDEILTHLTDGGEKVKLSAGDSLYYVGKMYIPSNYQWSNEINMIDFDLSASYTLDFVQQTN